MIRSLVPSRFVLLGIAAACAVLAIAFGAPTHAAAQQSSPALPAPGTAVAAALTVGAPSPAPSDSLIRPTDLLKIHHLSQVALSPDGRYAAYVVKRIVDAPSNTQAGDPYAYQQQIHVVPANGREAPRMLTRHPDGASQPAWHPESDRLAFVRPVDGTPQVFILPLSGGEPYQLTDAEHGATQPQFGPGGERLLYASSLTRSQVERRLAFGAAFPHERPGRSPADTLRRPRTDTLVVLRDSLTLDPVDTLNVSLSDSLAVLTDSLGLLPDTLRRTVTPPRVADPDGSLDAVRRWLGERRSTHDPKVITRLDFQGERSLAPEPSFQHYFVADVPGGISQGSPPRPSARPVTGGYRSFSGAEWLPSGSQVVVSGTPPNADTHPDRIRRRDLYLADVPALNAAGSPPRVRRLLRLERHALSSPQVTGDGTTVAFLARSLDHSGYAQSEIGLFALDGRTKPRIVTADYDRSVSQLRWSPGGWYLYAVAPSEGGFPLVRFAPFARGDTTESGAAPPPQEVPNETSADAFQVDTTMTSRVPREVLTARGRGIRSYDATDATLVYVATDPSNPYELFTSAVNASGEKRLSTHNASWLAGRRLAPHRKLQVPVAQSARAGTPRDTIDAWVIRPPTLAEGRQAPLLVEMHGGPMAMWGPGEATMWHEFQMLAARGFAIVYANPRGSGGYGRAFKTANFQDWGPGPAADVLAAADAAARLPWTDANRQVLTGGSYAGYLTAWIVSQTDRFDAAVAQRGVYDLSTFFGEGNAWRLVPTHFGGYPWEGVHPSPAADTLASDSSFVRDGRPRAWGFDSLAVDSLQMPPRDALLRNSPQTFADDIRTPLLILHADDDLRTGVVQSELLYKSLKVMGRPVEYVRYPNAGHDLSRTGAPHHRINRLLRIYEFLARYTSGAEATAEPAERKE